MGSQAKQIIIVLAAVVLILAATVFIWAGSHLYDEILPSSNETDSDNKSARELEPLEVTYWNPWVGPTDYGRVTRSTHTSTLPIYVSDSKIIVSATVTDLKHWTDETEEGRQKLEELDSCWNYPHATEYFFEVHDVLKGDRNFETVYVKTDVLHPSFEIGDECILFITDFEKYPLSQTEGSIYQIYPNVGFLVKNGSEYKGTHDLENISATKEDLMFLLSLSEDEIDVCHDIVNARQVFFGEMLTSTNDADLVHTGAGGSKQDHQVFVIETLKGNKTGDVEFTYTGAYLTNEMMEIYLSKLKAENRSLPSEYKQNETGYYNPVYWDPEISPLKAGGVYLFYLWDYKNETEFTLSASSLYDYRIDDKEDPQKVKDFYRTVIEKYGRFFVMRYYSDV